ncbi:hypothetical protein Bbelb_148480 [Branchiostoma belcheri]|nr:hypothetical protein Bbelb_148480 [Branchiostoma belcheri]
MERKFDIQDPPDIASETTYERPRTSITVKSPADYVHIGNALQLIWAIMHQPIETGDEKPSSQKTLRSSDPISAWRLLKSDQVKPSRTGSSSKQRRAVCDFSQCMALFSKQTSEGNTSSKNGLTQRAKASPGPGIEPTPNPGTSSNPDALTIRLKDLDPSPKTGLKPTADDYVCIHIHVRRYDASTDGGE